MTVLGESPAKGTVNRGALRLAEGDVDGAETMFREAIDLDPANPTAHANLGYVLALTERHEEAIRESEEALAREPDRSGPWAHIGISRLALGEIDAGLSALSRAVRLDPRNHFAWHAMGRVLLALGRAKEAELAWASAVAARPNDVDLLIGLAVVLSAQGRTGEAVHVLHRATSIAPDSSRAWTQLGVASILNHDHGTAGDALLNALELDPDEADARFHLALLHVLVGAIDEAVIALTALAAADSEIAPEARALLGRLSKRTDNGPD
jgi:Flp pilus assembly protein TadD